MTPRGGPRVRVLLADDHAVLRAGLRALIAEEPDMLVVAEAADGAETLRAAGEAAPDVAVFDLTMPDTDAIATIRALTRRSVRVVVLTMHDDPAYLEAALAAGATGYVVKRAADTALLEAVRAVSAGSAYVDATSRRPAAHPTARLSPREEDVLRRVASGHTSREIAAELGVSVKTVETFRARITRKLGIHSRADLVRYAMRIGLVGGSQAGDQDVPRRRPSRPRRPRR